MADEITPPTDQDQSQDQVQQPPPDQAPDPQPQSDPHLASLVDSVRGVIKRDQEDPVKKAEEALAASQQVQADPTPPPAAPEKVVVKKPSQSKSNIEKMIEEALKKVTSQQSQQPAPVQQQPPTPSREDQIVAALDDDAREEIAIAKFAEKSAPEKYKGLASKYVDFHAEDLRKREALLKEDPDRTLDESDEDYQTWLAKSRPKIPTGEKLRLVRQMAKEETLAEVDARLAAEREARAADIRAAEARPIVEKRAIQFGDVVTESISMLNDEAAADVVAAIKAGKPIEEADPIAGPIFQEEITNAQKMATEFLAISTGASKLNLENPTHKRLVEFVQGQDDAFDKHGGDLRVFQGKTFMPRRKLIEAYNTDPTVIERHWTTTDDQILASISENAKISAVSRTKKELERIQKAGFSRAKPQQQATPVKPEVASPAQKQQNPPTVKGSIAPGAAQITPPKPGRFFSDSELSLLAST